ncbi:uncharacterized protein LOC134819030 [Bolinopsis microptera]|uniref:uncharacterized protein LOC134819030 n=1 Tax=Bolinopsis microptera TaxID=2820187 RepID=UPI003078CEB7
MAAADHFSSLPGEEVGGARGQMIYTGNNGIGNYRSHVVTDYECIGETIGNPSSTTSMKFLSREPEGSKYPPRRKAYVGEVGWMVEDKFHNSVNDKVLKSGNQIQLKVYRQSLEDNATNRAIHTIPVPDYGDRGVSGYAPGMPLNESLGYTDGTRQYPMRVDTSTSTLDTDK